MWSVTAQMDARFETVSKQMVDFQKVCDEQNEEFTKEHEELKNQLSTRDLSASYCVVEIVKKYNIFAF